MILWRQVNGSSHHPTENGWLLNLEILADKPMMAFMARFLIPLISTSVLVPVSLLALSNPLPSIQASSISLRYEDFATIPNSAASAPYTRIVLMRPLNDGTGRTFVPDLNGRISVVDSQGNVKTYHDVKAATGGKFRNSPGLGTGLSAVAIHPEFASNGKFYTTHSEAPGSGNPDFTPPHEVAISLQGVVIEWTADDPAANFFTGTRRELMRIDIPGTLHGMQDMSFNPFAQPGDPDYGILYICIGDGGSMIDGHPENTGVTNSVLGTVLRIDPEGSNSANGQYGIPEDNPFVDDSGATKEIWAYGFRNPHRISFDLPPASEDESASSVRAFVADIGERNIEELNLVVPGGNHGWPDREGAWFFDRNSGDDGYNIEPLPEDEEPGKYVYPVAMYDHQDGRSIAGGFVYRGKEIPELQGYYLAGDIVSGRLLLVDASKLKLGSNEPFQEFFLEDSQGARRPLLTLVRERVNRAARADLRFGTDANGELYVLTKQDGKIRKLSSVNPPQIPSPFPGEPGLKDTFLGEINDSLFPWIETDWGYLWVASTDRDDLWLYNSEMDLWFWTSEAVHPWYYIKR